MDPMVRELLLPPITDRDGANHVPQWRWPVRYPPEAQVLRIENGMVTVLRTWQSYLELTEDWGDVEWATHGTKRIHGAAQPWWVIEVATVHCHEWEPDAHVLRDWWTSSDDYLRQYDGGALAWIQQLRRVARALARNFLCPSRCSCLVRPWTFFPWRGEVLRYDPKNSMAMSQSLPCGVPHPILEGKPNADHVHVRVRNSRTQQIHIWTSSHIAQSK
jgi:hypothetical protein